MLNNQTKRSDIPERSRCLLAKTKLVFNAKLGHIFITNELLSVTAIKIYTLIYSGLVSDAVVISISLMSVFSEPGWPHSWAWLKNNEPLNTHLETLQNVLMSSDCNGFTPGFIQVNFSSCL